MGYMHAKLTKVKPWLPKWNPRKDRSTRYQCLWTIGSNSSMWIVKSNGPKTESWGTPLVTDTVEDLWFWIATFCCLSLWYESQERADPVITTLRIQESNRSWDMILNVSFAQYLHRNPLVLEMLLRVFDKPKQHYWVSILLTPRSPSAPSTATLMYACSCSFWHWHTVIQRWWLKSVTHA